VNCSKTHFTKSRHRVVNITRRRRSSLLTTLIGQSTSRGCLLQVGGVRSTFEESVLRFISTQEPRTITAKQLLFVPCAFLSAWCWCVVVYNVHDVLLIIAFGHGCLECVNTQQGGCCVSSCLYSNVCRRSAVFTQLRLDFEYQAAFLSKIYREFPWECSGKRISKIGPYIRIGYDGKSQWLERSVCGCVKAVHETQKVGS